MDINSILIITASVLVFIIIILIIIYWKMSIDDKKGKEIRKKEKNKEGIDQKDITNPQSYTKQSVFSFMEFDKVEDNMIIQKKGNRFLMVVECQGINYDLMSGVEKTSVEDGFSQFLNILRHPIQIYTQTRTINLEDSINTYKNRIDEIKNELNNKENKYKQMKESGKYNDDKLFKQKIEIDKQRNLYEYGKDVIYNTERMSLNKNVLRKQYYIVISYYSSESGNDLLDKEEIRNLAFSELYTKAQSMIRTLAACNVMGRVLDSYDLVDLLYNAYNRDEAETYGMRKAIEAGYDELYVTAQDVIDKKIEELDKKIEQEALEKARNIVDEVISEKQRKLNKKEETLEDLIDEMAMIIIKENEEYIGEDVAENAVTKVKKGRKSKDKGGDTYEEKEKTSRRRIAKQA